MGQTERLAADFSLDDPEEKAILQAFHDERRTRIPGVELQKTDLLRAILRERYAAKLQGQPCSR